MAGLAGQAAAQVEDPRTLPPPVISSVDENGVDMSSGRFMFDGPGLSIGGPEGGLGFRFIDLQLRADNTGEVTTKPFAAGVTQYTVTLGGRSSIFTHAAGASSMTLIAGEGHQTLESDGTPNLLTFTDSVGAVFTFGAVPGSSTSWRLTSLARPDGEVLTYAYTGAQLQSVTTNLGYMLHYQYRSSGSIEKITAINLGVDYCAPTAATCSGLTQSWPTLTFSDRTAATQPVTITDSLSRSTTITPNGNVVVIQSPEGRTRTITYGSNASLNGGASVGRVIQYTDGRGTWTYAYDRPNFSTAPATDVELIVYKIHPGNREEAVKSRLFMGQAIEHTDARDRERHAELEASGAIIGRVKQIVHPFGNITEYLYDSRENRTAVVNHSPTADTSSQWYEPAVTELTGYEANCGSRKTCNKPIYIRDSAGNQTDYEYSPLHGGLTLERRPAGADGVRPEIRYTYTGFKARYKNAQGVLSDGDGTIYRVTEISTCVYLANCVGTANESRTTISYARSGYNNLTVASITTADGGGSTVSTTSLGYNDFGDLSSVNGPLPGSADTIAYRYDAVRQLRRTIYPDPDGGGALQRRAERRDYTLEGEISSIEVGSVAGLSDVDWSAFASASAQTFHYNAGGLLDRVAQAEGGVTRSLIQHSYDPSGRVICTAQRMNPAAFGSPPASACDAGPTGDFGPDRIQQFGYYADDTIQSIVQTAHMPSAGYPAGVSQIMYFAEYTLNGKLAWARDGRGVETHYEYDGLDRLKKVKWPDKVTVGEPSSDDFVLLSYAPTTWNLVQENHAKSGHVFNYTYDARGNRRTTSLPFPITYTYDNLDRLVGAAGEGRNVVQPYDALGRLSVALGPQGAVSFQYNEAGARTRTTWADGFFVSYDYDDAGRLKYIRENGAGSGEGVLATFSYDNLGRRSNITLGNGVATTYAYDGLSRLTGLSHDLPGTANDQTLTFTYTPANQIATRTSNNPAYAWADHYAVDREYQINGQNQVTQAGTVLIEHDDRGNITKMPSLDLGYDAANHVISATNGTSLNYDALGRLNRIEGNGSVSKFQYDGGRQVAEYNAAGAIARRYVFGPAGDEPIVWYEGAGTTSRNWLAADNLGSIVSVTNSAGATTINTYDEYGIPGASNLGAFQYTGQTWLPQLGVYHYKARDYSPTLGRFLQRDPLGYVDGPNLYAYVGNDPVNLIDPKGLSSTPVSEVIVNAIRGIAGVGQVASATQSEVASNPFGQIVDTIVEAVEVIAARPKCPTGSRLTIGFGWGATLFGVGGVAGGSIGAGGAITIPKESLAKFSLRGMQIGANASVTGLAGFGAFAGTGPSFSGGISKGAAPVGWSSQTSTVLQMGAGYGAGVEASGVLMSNDYNYGGGMGPSGSIGAYGAFGRQFTVSNNSPQYGCRSR